MLKRIPLSASQYNCNLLAIRYNDSLDAGWKKILNMIAIGIGKMWRTRNKEKQQQQNVNWSNHK